MTRQTFAAGIRVAVAAGGCATVLACTGAREQQGGPLSESDRRAILRLDSSFVGAWLRDDTAAVLRTFSDDAVLLPPNSNPVIGRGKIREYWWPQDGSHTTITSFERQIVEIAGNQGLAYARGTAKLSWSYAKNDSVSSQTSRSMDLLVLATDSLGKWHVIRQMWSTLP